MTIIVVLRSFEREEPLYMTLAILRDTSDLDGLQTGSSVDLSLT